MTITMICVCVWFDLDLGIIFVGRLSCVQNLCACTIYVFTILCTKLYIASIIFSNRHTFWLRVLADRCSLSLFLPPLPTVFGHTSRSDWRKHCGHESKLHARPQSGLDDGQTELRVARTADCVEGVQGRHQPEEHFVIQTAATRKTNTKTMDQVTNTTYTHQNQNHGSEHSAPERLHAARCARLSRASDRERKRARCVLRRQGA